MKNDVKKPKSVKDFSVVGIGASAGGIEALKNFFAETPADSGMAFVVILHLSQEHESHLAEILQSAAKIPVRQITKTVRVEPNQVYVIPPAKGLKIVDGTIQLTEPERARGKRVPIDLFFRSLADAYGRNAISVILSGSGSDGTLGLKRVKECGGVTVAQSPDDAEYDSMPRSAIGTNLVDVILPAAEIPEKIIGIRRLADKHDLAPEDGHPPQDAIGDNSENALREVLTILRIRTGHDFSNYKRPTLLRRIARRLQIHELATMREYVGFMRENAGEVQTLLSNLLITVTNFFRDKEAFAALEAEIVPRLFAGKTRSDELRIWAVGCATGEEAYSIAMLLHEYAEIHADAPKIQIFASDINEEAIARARECMYVEAIVADVSPQRLKRFFSKEGSYYRIEKRIRESVLFTPHDVLRDPPFSRLDLIICRNLLIYFNRDTQKRVLEIFHFALKQDGILFLGASESHETVPTLFTALDKKQRIFKNRPSRAVHKTLPKMPTQGGWNISLPEHEAAPAHEKAPSYGDIHVRLVEQFAPPSVLANEDYEIVHVSENAGRFLRIAAGEPTRDLLKTIHPSLKLDLQSALIEAKQKRKASKSRNVRFVRTARDSDLVPSRRPSASAIEGRIDKSPVARSTGSDKSDETLLNITVNFIEGPETADGFYLITFDESNTPTVPLRDGEKAQTIAGRDGMDGMINNLETELSRTKSRLRGTIEQHETSSEELKASNEELQAVNEELRSASEELETSKEELQSLNEELTTVNHELREKMREVQIANADLNNLIQSTDIGSIFLDRNLRIKRFTPRIEELFNLIPSDLGRPLDHVTHQLDYEFLARDAAEVLKTLHIEEREVRGGGDDSRYLVRLAPYRTLDDKIDGVVLSFQDITELKRAAELVEESEARFSAIVNQAITGIAQTDLTGKFVLLNKRYCENLGYSCEELLGRRMHDITHKEDLPGNVELFERAVETGESFTIEKRYIRKDGSTVWVQNAVTAILDAAGKPKSLLAVTLDITERKAMEKVLRESEEHLRLLIESASDFAIIGVNPEGCVTSWNRGAEFIFGWKESEAVGQTAAIIFTPEDRKQGIPEKEMKTVLETGRAEDDRQQIRKDGSLIQVSGVMARLADGQGFVKVVRDMTAKIEAENLLRQKLNLQRMVAAQEDERKRIARDLHDHIGQQLTALNLKIALLKADCGDKSELCSQVEDLEAIGKNLDKDTDFLVWELRPTALDDLGLAAGLTNFAQSWSKVFGIELEIMTNGFGTGARLTPEVETSLYRIAQEALNNIAKHADAKNVSVVLDNRDETVSLIVEDDGKGFDVENVSGANDKGLGLVGMSERAALVGGTFEIESVIGKGTTTFVRVPAGDGLASKKRRAPKDA
ncbi:MAG: PAS domain S-box protein [Acidobacteria bacterium]|nr:PAS domain S-box protein [Acidobacteriota bacterium]